MTTDWVAYFDRLRQDSPLHREQSALYVQAVTAEVRLRRDQRVLDFGCGFGLVTARLAPLVAEMWWWDPSPTMRAVAARSTAAFPNTRFCDLSAEGAGEAGGTAWRRPAFDLILVNSVVQYMAAEELTAWLLRWRRMLAPGGAVVVSDLLAPGHSGWSDVVDLLRLGAGHGSPLRAVREALGGVGRYWRTSRAAPLVRVGQEDFARRAADAGLELTVLPRNLTHFRTRWAAVLRPRPAGSG